MKHPIYSNTNRLIALSLLGLTSLLMVACSQDEGGGSESQYASQMQSGAGAQVLSKVLVDEAELEDLKQHKADCKSKSSKHEKKICIEVCHLPPGNPTTGKTHILPLESLKAHLNHGSDHHADKDYLGKCRTNEGEGPVVDEPVVDIPVVEEPVIDAPVVDAPVDSTTDTSTDSTPTTDSTTVDPTTDSTVSTNPVVDSQIPNWCVPFVDIDSNCDGIVDATNEPLF